jgi:hypothetical protein
MTMTQHPRTARAFRAVQVLGWGYLCLSVLALLAIFLLRNDPAEVNQAAWIRGSIVVATGIALIAFIERMTGGSSGAYRRLRIISIIVPIAFAVIVAIPGMLPLWMRVEQGACGLLMIGIALVLNGKLLRELFSGEISGEGVPTSTT